MQFKPSKIRKAKYALDKRLVYEKGFYEQIRPKETLITEPPKKEGVFKRLFGWLLGGKK